MANITDDIAATPTPASACDLLGRVRKMEPSVFLEHSVWKCRYLLGWQLFLRKILNIFLAITFLQLPKIVTVLLFFEF